MLLSQCERGANARFEKTLIHFHALRSNHAHVDLRFRIPETNPEQALAMIFYLDDVAVIRRGGSAQDSALINPRMSREDAVGFAWFDKNSCERVHCKHAAMAAPRTWRTVRDVPRGFAATLGLGI